MCISLCTYIHIYVSIYLSIYPSIYLSLSLSLYIYIYAHMYRLPDPSKEFVGPISVAPIPGKGRADRTTRVD